VAVTPLTPGQQAAVDDLVRDRRIGPVPASPARAQQFLAQAADTLDELPHITRPAVRYTLAYDACHDVGEAFLAAYGYRTLSGPGQHEAVGRFLLAVLDDAEGQRAARRFEQLRRGRNQQRYDAKPVGAADADLAVTTAGRLHALASSRGIGT
jgi:hypothetical protein